MPHSAIVQSRLDTGNSSLNRTFPWLPTVPRATWLWQSTSQCYPTLTNLLRQPVDCPLLFELFRSSLSVALMVIVGDWLFVLVILVSVRRVKEKQDRAICSAFVCKFFGFCLSSLRKSRLVSDTFWFVCQVACCPRQLQKLTIQENVKGRKTIGPRFQDSIAALK